MCPAFVDLDLGGEDVHTFFGTFPLGLDRDRIASRFCQQPGEERKVVRTRQLGEVDIVEHIHDGRAFAHSHRDVLAGDEDVDEGCFHGVSTLEVCHLCSRFEPAM